jgi:type IV secretory pathway protease TraF
MRLIKRVTALIGPDQVVLTGDNPAESTDSLSFGPVKERQIVGQVTSRFG